MNTTELIEVIEGLDVSGSTADSEAVDKACDALSFTGSLWQLFQEQGFAPRDSDEVDYNLMENIIDGLNGELAAACLFFTDPGFAAVPDSLRAIADALEKSNPDGVVPIVVAKGYRRLAQRIENTRAAVETAKKMAQENAEAAKKNEGGPFDILE